jgi:CheY-like chemotaxis protein
MVKILFLVDDDRDDREIFEEALMECDPSIDLIFAKDGVEALEILDSGNILPDVIFLDYNMPRMNGMECLKKLKANQRTKQIPTVMYTTSGDRALEKTLLMLGADHYMQKTVGFKELCVELKRLLEIVGQKLLARKRELK